MSLHNSAPYITHNTEDCLVEFLELRDDILKKNGDGDKVRHLDPFKHLVPHYQCYDDLQLQKEQEHLQKLQQGQQYRQQYQQSHLAHHYNRVQQNSYGNHPNSYY